MFAQDIKILSVQYEDGSGDQSGYLQVEFSDGLKVRFSIAGLLASFFLWRQQTDDELPPGEWGPLTLAGPLEFVRELAPSTGGSTLLGAAIDRLAFEIEGAPPQGCAIGDMLYLILENGR